MNRPSIWDACRKSEEDGVRHFADLEDRKHLHFRVAKSEIPKGRRTPLGVPADVISS
jgi:hypothetical protein